jgi:hypothetical protein
VGGEEEVEYLVEGDHVRIVGEPDRLGMPVSPPHTAL